MQKKFKLLENITMEHNGRTLYRIKALRDFGNVYEGDLGGWVESEENLSHEGNCWIYDEGKVYKHGHVIGDGKVLNFAEVYDYSTISGKGQALDNAKVYDSSKVMGEAYVAGKCNVYGKSLIMDKAFARGDSTVDNCTMSDFSSVEDNATIIHIMLDGRSTIFGNARVTDVKIPTDAEVGENANVKIDTDVFVVSFANGLGVTFYKDVTNGVSASCNFKIYQNLDFFEADIMLDVKEKDMIPVIGTMSEMAKKYILR